jgi:hypothetical protein
MTRCIACGTENKAGARVCRQCGILIGSPAADTDAELTVAGPAPAAPATVNVDDRDTVITRWASQRSAEPIDGVEPPRAASPPSAATTPPAPVPSPTAAPATRPRSRAWLIGSLAAAALMLIGAFAYVVIGSGKRTAEHAAAPKTAPAAKAPAPAAVQPPPVAVALAPPPAEPAPAPTPEIAAGQAQPASTEPVAAAAQFRGTAADTSQRPGKPAADTAREKQRAERARQREAAAAAKRAAAQSAPAAQPDLVASADQPPEPKPLSRWDRMAQENSACEAEGFFGRLACKEKLRWKYCPGYWGKVAQCPEGQSQGGGN